MTMDILNLFCAVSWMLLVLASFDKNFRPSRAVFALSSFTSCLYFLQLLLN